MSRNMDLVFRVLRELESHLSGTDHYQLCSDGYECSDDVLSECIGFLKEHKLVVLDGEHQESSLSPYDVVFVGITWRGRDLLDNLRFVGDKKEVTELANRCSFDVFERALKTLSLKLVQNSWDSGSGMFSAMGYDASGRYYLAENGLRYRAVQGFICTNPDSVF